MGAGVDRWAVVPFPGEYRICVWMSKNSIRTSRIIQRCSRWSSASRRNGKEARRVEEDTRVLGDRSLTVLRLDACPRFEIYPFFRDARRRAHTGQHRQAGRQGHRRRWRERQEPQPICPGAAVLIKEVRFGRASRRHDRRGSDQRKRSVLAALTPRSCFDLRLPCPPRRRGQARSRPRSIPGCQARR